MIVVKRTGSHVLVANTQEGEEANGVNTELDLLTSGYSFFDSVSIS